MGFLVPPIKDFKNGLRRKLNAILLEFKEENCGAGKLSISAAALTKTMEHRKRTSHRHGGATSNHLARGTNQKGTKYQRRFACTLPAGKRKIQNEELEVCLSIQVSTRKGGRPHRASRQCCSFCPKQQRYKEKAHTLRKGTTTPPIS